MIFLEQTVNQILREEGQVLLKLSDLNITWEMLEQTFIGTFEQAKGYISIYDWTEELITSTPKKVNYSHIKHITYPSPNGMQRFMPDMPQQYWEFNPWTKKVSSLMNMNFNLEVGRYPTLEQLEYELDLTNIKKGKSKRFFLPCTPTDDIKAQVNGSAKEIHIEATETEYSDVEKNDYLDNSRECPCQNSNETGLELTGDVNGFVNYDTLSGDIKFNEDFDSVTITFLSKYVGIRELDLSCELFYNWFKSNVLMLIGSMKAQIDLSSAGLPFDFNADGVLDRAKELRTKVEELKLNKSNWSDF